MDKRTHTLAWAFAEELDRMYQEGIDDIAEEAFGLAELAVAMLLEGSISIHTAECRHCNREIAYVGERWIDPEATGDDDVWRETCDSNDTFTAEHEPTEG